MQLKQTSPAIFELKDQPGCFWLFSIFFITLGGLALAGMLGLFNLDEISLTGKILTWTLALAAISVGIFLLYRSPGSRVRFDVQQGKMVVFRRGLLRIENAEYLLDEIDEITLGETTDIDGDPVHQIWAELKSEEVVPLSLLWLHNRERLEMVRKEILQFLQEKGYRA